LRSPTVLLVAAAALDAPPKSVDMIRVKDESMRKEETQSVALFAFFYV
jgi:hypothetical protein